MGEGWNKIIDEHKNHQLQPKMPKVKADRYSILVIIYSVKDKFESRKLRLNERQKRAINYVRNSKNITNSEYQTLNKTTKKSATRDLQSLVKQNIFLRKGVTGKGVYYTIDPTYKGDIRGHYDNTSRKPKNQTQQTQDTNNYNQILGDIRSILPKGIEEIHYTLGGIKNSIFIAESKTNYPQKSPLQVLA